MIALGWKEVTYKGKYRCYVPPADAQELPVFWEWRRVASVLDLVTDPTKCELMFNALAARSFRVGLPRNHWHYVHKDFYFIVYNICLN
jgi:hypothetical protein